MKSFERIILGIAGGVAAVCVKFLGQDYHMLLSKTDDLMYIDTLKIGYIVLAPILVFLGALLAWVSDTQTRWQTLAVAIAAPAIVTTWAGGDKGDLLTSVSLNPISAAYAQTEQDTKSSSKYYDGVRSFFGVRKTPSKSRSIKPKVASNNPVTVGYYDNHDNAQAKADALNKIDPNYAAKVRALEAVDGRRYAVVMKSQ